MVGNDFLASLTVNVHFHELDFILELCQDALLAIKTQLINFHCGAFVIAYLKLLLTVLAGTAPRSVKFYNDQFLAGLLELLFKVSLK